MQNRGMTELSEYTYERDRNEFNLGDTLDIKTGLLLASLTFLAIQSAELIKPGLPLSESIAQAISVLCLIAGGGLCVVELWPRHYVREALPDRYEAWISETEKFREDEPYAEPITEEKLHSARFSAAMERVRENSAINKRKSSLMFWAFYCLVASFVANVGTLAMRLF